MKSVIWIDCETTGLDPLKQEITQLAGVVEVDGKVQEEFELRMRPNHPENASAEALAVTKQTMADIMAHPLSQAEGYRAFVAILAKRCDKYNRSDKYVWGGQNPRFDIDFVRALFLAHGDKYYGSWFWGTAIDLGGFALALQIIGLMPPTINHKLGTICEALQVPLDAHKALDDVRATRTAFYKLVERLRTPAKA